MATVAPIVYSSPSENELKLNSKQVGGGMSRLSNPSYNGVYTNWHNYNANNNVDANLNAVKTMPSPSSTLSSFSARSSPNSSPSTGSSKHSDSMPSPAYFSSYRPRSNSIAIPAPTSCCSNCGLRRPSTVSDQMAAPLSDDPKTPTRQRPHLPLHLHCPEPCPDVILPAKGSASPTSPYNKQRHHRRRSSLCYAESLVDDANMIDGGTVPFELKQTWEKQAENIARKVILRKPSPDSALALESAIIED